MAICGLTLMAGEILGQENYEMSKAEHQTADSVQTARDEQQMKGEQAEEDASRLAAAKAAERETKAKAREIRQIDAEARRAAREAKMALRAEKKAQKARKDADKQSRKAERAKRISDKNKADKS